MSSAAIEGRALRRSFGDVVAVDGVDIDVRSGEIHAIVGLNGAGKTTLMRMLLGMIRVESGEVLIDGTPLGAVEPGQWATVGYLIETPFAYPELTVIENLWMSARLRGLDRTAVDGLVNHAVDRLDLETWADKRAATLSMGNRQRLGLATATIHNPSLMVLDEPANALDPAGVVLVRGFLREEATSGKAILVSSHHLDEIARIADRITVLHRGRVVGGLDPTEPDLERRFFEIAYAADRAIEETPA